MSEAIASRFSARAFLDRPVDQATVRSILERAAQTPSGGNLQPWHVHVLMGDRLERFKSSIETQLADYPMGVEGEYNVYPPSLQEPYRSRRYRCGEDLYAAIGIAREDKPGRLRQFANNFHFFGAPVALFIAIDRKMEVGQWSDVGMFIMNLMLLAREEGLHTCGQESWSRWYQAVGDHIELPPELMLFCGVALGYVDETQPINGWRTERAQIEAFVTWHD